MHPGDLKMRTNVELDEKLLRRVMELTGAKTFRQALHVGLQTVVNLHAQGEVKALRGKLRWEGDLQKLRRS